MADDNLVKRIPFILRFSFSFAEKDMNNPWKVDSVQAFNEIFLKCPECAFTTKEEACFRDHAVKNHPLSVVLYGRSKEATNRQMEDDFGFDLDEDSPEIFFSGNVEPMQVMNKSIETIVNENISNANTSQKWANWQNTPPKTPKTTVPSKKYYDCKYCKFVCISRVTLSMHITKTHSNNSNFHYNCKICSHVCWSQLGLDKHIYQEHSQKNPKAHERNKPKTNLIQSTKIQCKDCEFVCRAQATLIRHNATVHSNVSKLNFDCNICSQEYSSKLRLDNHLLKEHDGKNYFECGNCGSRFHKKEQLITHLRSHEGRKPFYCVICDDSFSKQHHLSLHFQIVHEGKNPNIPKDVFKQVLCPSGKVFNCGDCKYRSRDYKLIKSHIELQHKPRAGEPYACFICDFQTEKTHLWINHMKTILCCTVCGEKFHAYLGSKQQNRQQVHMDYNNHVKTKHPEIEYPFMRSEDYYYNFETRQSRI